MTKKIIAVDIDDVIADSTEAYRLMINKRMSVNLKPEHYMVQGPYWQYYEHVWSSNGLDVTKIPLEELEGQMINDQSHILPKDGAQNALVRLAQTYSIVMVTARNPAWAKETENWLHTHYKGLFDDVHVIGSKAYQGDAARSKGEVCKEIGASWLIDDNPEHCLSAIEHGIDAVLFGNYGWHFDAPEHLVRCHTWAEVLEYFDAL